MKCHLLRNVLELSMENDEGSLKCRSVVVAVSHVSVKDSLDLPMTSEQRNFWPGICKAERLSRSLFCCLIVSNFQLVAELSWHGIVQSINLVQRARKCTVAFGWKFIQLCITTMESICVHLREVCRRDCRWGKMKWKSAVRMKELCVELKYL